MRQACGVLPMLGSKADVAGHRLATMPIRVELGQTLRQTRKRMLQWRDDHLTLMNGQLHGLINM